MKRVLTHDVHANGNVYVYLDGVLVAIGEPVRNGYWVQCGLRSLGHARDADTVVAKVRKEVLG